MKNVSIIEIILYVIACVFSSIFFKGSIVMMAAMFGFISLMITKEGEDYKNTKLFRIMKTICALGLILIILGHVILHNDTMFVIGAFLFSATLAPLIVKDLLEYIKRSKNRSDE